MKKLELNQMENIEGGDFDWGCFWSVAGTIATTAGAIAVTGGAGLVIFIAAKAIGTASIVTSC